MVSQLMTAVCVSMLLADQTVKCFACYSRKALCVVHLLFDVLKERPECCVRKVVVPGSYYCAKFNTTTTILIVMLLLLINSVLFSSVRKKAFTVKKIFYARLFRSLTSRSLLEYF